VISRVIIPAVLGLLILGFAALRIAALIKFDQRPRHYRLRIVFDLILAAFLIRLAFLAARP
jgi:hypothetical protein